MRLAVALPVALACLLSGPVMGETVPDGNLLYGACLSDEPFDRGFCLGTISGAATGIVLGIGLAPHLSGRPHENPQQAYCLPPNSTNRQYRDVVVKYLEENPADRHNLIVEIVTAAMVEAFPCEPA